MSQRQVSPQAGLLDVDLPLTSIAWTLSEAWLSLSGLMGDMSQQERDRERYPWQEGGQVRRSQLSQTAKAQMSYTYVYLRDNTYEVVMDLNCSVRTRIGIQVVSQ